MATLFLPFFAGGAEVLAPITLGEAKAYLRVDSDDEDAMISDLIRTAATTIEGMTGWVSRSRTITLTRTTFAPRIPLYRAPVSAIGSIEYVDPEGADQTVDPADYVLREFAGVPVIRLASGSTWPNTLPDDGQIAITFTAGFASNDLVDHRIRTMARLLVAHWYANRDSSSVPPAVADLASQIRLADI